MSKEKNKEIKDFKLIAIRPLPGCHKNYRRVLKEGELFQFYNEYSFEPKDNSLNISENNPVHLDFYKLKTKENLGKSVSISAIVGKNGSGKSSLIELLFLSMYVIATKSKILSPNLPELDELIKEATEKQELEDLTKYQKQKSDLEFIYNNLKVELFYKIDENYFCIIIDNGFIKQKVHGDKGKERNYKIISILEGDENFNFSDFFYSISTNYSFYSLNSELIGDWISTLFHKNDGYQTPVVINPFRDKGNIDINKEIYLAKQRLLSNILKPVKNGNNSHHLLTEQQKTESLTFTLNKEKVSFAYKKKFSDKETKISFSEIFYDPLGNLSKREFLDKLYTLFCTKPKSLEEIELVKFHSEVEDYIIKKLIKIARTYPTYFAFFHENELLAQDFSGGHTKTNYIKLPANRFQGVDEYFAKLKEDESHITFKLRQAINYIHNDILHRSEEYNWKTNSQSQEQFDVTITELSERISRKIGKIQEIIYLIPPSLFNIEIHLVAQDNSDDSKSLFSDLSSGEQQLIQSVQTILYHINNVDSVFYDTTATKDENEESKKYYNYINLILDEIELYFHPDYQKKFISYLMNSLDTLDVPNIFGYNILFSTHSPFILSDIPVSNILKLEKGSPKPYISSDQSFGANVHDLLANDFFLKDGFMGDWAKSKIEEVITFLNINNLQKEIDGLHESDELYKIKKEEIGLLNRKEIVLDKKSSKKIIDLIGEPFLKSKLTEMHNEVYSNDNDLEALEEERNRIEEKIKLLRKN